MKHTRSVRTTESDLITDDQTNFFNQHSNNKQKYVTIHKNQTLAWFLHMAVFYKNTACGVPLWGPPKQCCYPSLSSTTGYVYFNSGQPGILAN